jgi:phosphatidylinositol glycan class B
VALASSAILDHLYFGGWPFTIYQFWRQNVLQGISGFYGIMSWHYYPFQALPMLTWTLLPFVLAAFFKKHLSPPLQQLRSCVAVVFLAFSFLQHKEVRFMQPLLPILHVFAGESLSKVKRKSIRLALIISSGLPAIYALRYHAQAQVSVTHYLRHSDAASVGFLMPCHSTPWQAYLHRQDLEMPEHRGSGEGGKLWFITCEPPVLYV